MRARSLTLLATLPLAIALGGSRRPATAQEPGAASEAQTVDVFIDCQAFFCDEDHFRREIGFVNWVRDRQDSDVHALLTAQDTGGGGERFTLAFIGRGPFAGRADTLSYTSRNTDTDAEVRDGLTHRLRLGLVRFAAYTRAASLIDVELRDDAGLDELQMTSAEDPWDFWTFRVSLGGSLDGEAQQRGRSIRGSFDASRTTEAFKIEIGVFGRYSRDEFELSDTTTFINTSERVFADVLLVWSLGPHWSAGVGADASRSTFSSRDLGVALGPAVEYNIFPYSESTRRQITFRYRVEPTVFDYQEITVNGELGETLARHSIAIGAEVRQPWGNVNGSIRTIQYLHDLSVHRIDTFAGMEFRIIRGLNFDVFGNFSRIKDQFSLPAGGLSDEEILVLRRQRETDFEFRLNLGLSFRFGSEFANVVNPRM